MNGVQLQALIDFADPRGGPRLRAAFGAPLRVLRADQPDEVLSVLAAVQGEAVQGRWCVGHVAYEAAPAFDSALAVHPLAQSAGPLAWFAVFDGPLGADVPQARAWAAGEVPDVAGHAVAHWAQGPDRAVFESDITTIQRAIAAGDLYQLNHTTRLRGQLRQGQPLALFAALHRAQPGGYAAYLDQTEQQLLSVSPELFFDWDAERLLVRPMKGTAPRGIDPERDAAHAQALLESPKERAENVMIVDLIRNDLSRVAQPHSVKVPRLFHLEALPAVWQMTSDVVATARPGVGLTDVFTALFPCGSITGAPKVQAMRQIRALEPEPRGVYCGAIGVVRPGQVPGSVRATFNVAIRSVTARAGRLSCGVGSGITSSATAAGEWREWRHKRAFLERASEPFQLLETLALEDGELRHLERHLARLAGAAAHFGYPWQVQRARDALQALAASHLTGLWRVRLLLDAQGQPEAQAYTMEPSPAEVILAVAEQAFECADSEFVCYKTTRRAHYDAVAPSQPGVFDTILWNERGELTECTRGNLALLADGQWWTPAASCGLLAGIGREVALADGRLRERVLTLDDLRQAQGLAFVNSLRGWIPARLFAQ